MLCWPNIGPTFRIWEISPKSIGARLRELTLFVVDTPANPSVPLDSDSEQTTPDTFGHISVTPFAFYDPNSHCLRTYQGTFALDSMLSSPILPRSGTMQRGRLYQRVPWVRHTHVAGCSLWRTPRASDGEGGGAKNRKRNLENLRDQVLRLSGLPYVNPTISEWLMGFPPKWTDIG